MMQKFSFIENKRFITAIVVITIALAIFAIFSSTTSGMAWLRVFAETVVP